MLTRKQSIAALAMIASFGLGSTLARAQPFGEPPALTVRQHHAWRHYAPPAEPLVIPLYPTGVVIQTPFTLVPSDEGPVAVRIPHRQGPDGSYDDLADLSNDIQGTPCGQECTVRALVRWGYQPVE